MNEDRSYGWEAIAEHLIAYQRVIGRTIIKEWTTSLKPQGAVLDIGAGTGEPATAILLEGGFQVSAVDAAPSIVAEYQRRFPAAEIVCEPAESSAFFNRTFDGALAIGLVFLLPESSQRQLIANVGKALNPGGRFLFNAPQQVCSWNDSWTNQPSQSLGRDAYIQAMDEAGLDYTESRVDEGESHYFLATKR